MKFIRLKKSQKITRFTRVHSKITQTINNCGERKYSFSLRCLQDTQGTLGMELLWSCHQSGAGIWWCNRPGVTHAPLNYLSTHSFLYVNTGYPLVHQARLGWVMMLLVVVVPYMGWTDVSTWLHRKTHTISSNADGRQDCRGCTEKHSASM